MEGMIPVSMEGQSALIYMRDADGKDWVAGCVLSALVPQDHAGDERLIKPYEDLKILAFKLVV